MKSFHLLNKSLKGKNLNPKGLSFYSLLINVMLGAIDEVFYNYLKEKKLKVIIKEGNYKVEDKHQVLACADLLSFDITLYLNPTELHKENYLQQIPDALFHELGHLRFQHLINLSMLSTELKHKVLNFCELSNIEGGVTLFANKYIKEEYGKKLREEDKHIINGIDIKYHENFAEFFKVYHIFKIDSKYIKDVKIEDYVSKKVMKTREVYESLSLYC